MTTTEFAKTVAEITATYNNNVKTVNVLTVKKETKRSIMVMLQRERDFAINNAITKYTNY